MSLPGGCGANMKINRKHRIVRRRGVRAAAIVESMISMLVILLILFGLLQLFHLSLAKVVSDYAAFRSARSAAVGFCDDLAVREAKVKSIPAAGLMTEPQKSSYFGSNQTQFAFEKTAVERYMNGTQYLNYEHWNDGKTVHNNYHCPYYGLSRTGGEAGCRCKCKPGTYAACEITRFTDYVRATFKFHEYPLDFPLHDAFFREDGITVGETVSLTNYA